ncbi:MAG: glycerate kinase [Lachnospiraceae bacterium]|nr:glycerate kinase [Lachnospiraceae bacterium]
MKLLFASDSFKGSLSSQETAEILARAAKEVFGDVTWSSVPVADGGEGTTDAVIAAENGAWIETEVCGPLMEKVTARYGKIDEKRAVIEMAAASGLPMVPEGRRNPLYTTSYGTGELIRHALDEGFTDISIAIGGSATNDGGMGCARALGVRFLDEEGRELEGRGEDLEKVSVIDVSGLDPRVSTAKITVMCDVTNPLCGENGATYTFGAQKGATPEIQARLEAGMVNYRDRIRKQFGIDPDAIEGAGAAGGLGTALMVFLGGEMKSGIETVLDLIGFDRRLEGVDLVVTGEGRTDWQSCFGKVMQGVGSRAKAKGVPAVGLSGSLGKDAAQIFDYGIESLMTTVDAPMPLEEALSRAQELYYLGAVRMFRFIRTGMLMAAL